MTESRITVEICCGAYEMDDGERLGAETMQDSFQVKSTVLGCGLTSAATPERSAVMPDYSGCCAGGAVKQEVRWHSEEQCSAHQ
jgi:hypothetical protein